MVMGGERAQKHARRANARGHARRADAVRVHGPVPAPITITL